MHYLLLLLLFFASSKTLVAQDWGNLEQSIIYIQGDASSDLLTNEDVDRIVDSVLLNGAGTGVNVTYETVPYSPTLTHDYSATRPNFTVTLTGNVVLDVDGPVGATGLASLIRDPGGAGTEAITLAGTPPWNEDYPTVAGGEILLEYRISPGGLNWYSRGPQEFTEIVADRVTLRDPNGGGDDAYIELAQDDQNASLQALYIVPPGGKRIFFGRDFQTAGDVDFRHAASLAEVARAKIGNIRIGERFTAGNYLYFDGTNMELWAKGQLKLFSLQGTENALFDGTNGVDFTAPVKVAGTTVHN